MECRGNQSRAVGLLWPWRVGMGWCSLLAWPPFFPISAAVSLLMVVWKGPSVGSLSAWDHGGRQWTSPVNDQVACLRGLHRLSCLIWHLILFIIWDRDLTISVPSASKWRLKSSGHLYPVMKVHLPQDFTQAACLGGQHLFG